MKILVVVDMQNDFIDGALGTPEAVSVVPYVKSLVEKFDGEVIFTRDTHFENYKESLEGKNLPVTHCIKDTHGWQIRKELDGLREADKLDKISFGSPELARIVSEKKDVESITLVGLCTDICVISNALILKAFCPETPIAVDARGCAGVTPESHKNALAAMKMCQIKILNED